MIHTPADVAALSRLLDEALDLAPTARPAWLAALGPEHAALRPSLERMLAEAETETALGLFAGPRLGEHDLSVVHAGERIGPYQVLSELGHGGMGTVWLAEGGPGGLRRRIALKLPRLAWGSGLAERMARERDIGALLEHPAIARLYDAGVDERGRPYLAFEHVAGVPIDAWCRERRPALAERLRLIVEVARALAYAHGRLVVHRDIKPSNVLVDDTGRAHLLDFGIAKLVDEVAGPKLTQEHSRLLTPHYAAPEQLRGEPVTVQSDVYALGLLAYELLAGVHPYEGQRNVADLVLALADGEPPPPSTRAREPPSAKALRGDVDAIVSMAIRHDPARRYASAEAFADDIERHLAGARVRAHPDLLGYRLVKMLRRHRVAFGAGTAVIAAVATGSAFALVQAVRAKAEAERARVVKEFVIDVFKVNSRQADNAELRQLPAELLLERGASLIERSFARKPDLQAELYGVVGGIFADMGSPHRAADYAGRQARLLEQIDAPADRRAGAAVLLGDAELERGHVPAAQAAAEQALALAPHGTRVQGQAALLQLRTFVESARYTDALTTLARFDRDFAGFGSLAAEARILRALVLVRSDRFDEAMPVYQAGIAQALAAEGPLSPVAIGARLTLAHTLVMRNRADEARPVREAALAALRALGGSGDLQAAREESASYWDLFSMGKIPAEEARRVIERNRNVVLARGPLVPERLRATVDLDLGSLLLDWGDIEGAKPLIDAAARVLSAPEETAARRFEIAAMQGVAALYAGRHAEADVYLGKRMEIQKAGGRTEHPMAAYDAAFVALNLIMQRRFDEADAVLAAAPDFDAIARRRSQELKGGHAKPFSVVRRMQVRARLERGDIAGARALLLPEETDDDVKFPMEDRVLRGAVLCAGGERAAGLAMLEEQLAFHERTDHERHPDLGRTRAIAGLCALAAGQTPKARDLAAAASGVFEGERAISPYFEAPLRELQRRLGPAQPK